VEARVIILLSAMTQACAVLSMQLALGALWTRLLTVCRGGRGRRNFRLTRPLRRVAPAALVAAGLSGVALFAWPAARGGLPGWFPTAVLFLLAGTPATAGAGLLVAAGGAERRGRLARAGRQSALGGRAMAVGTFLELGVVFAGLVLLPTAALRRLIESGWPAMAALIVCTIALGCAGFVGLLAGLTRKPRPSGTIAGLLYAASVVGLAAGRAGALIVLGGGLLTLAYPW
jgi:hypothetical protein